MLYESTGKHPSAGVNKTVDNMYIYILGYIVSGVGVSGLKYFSELIVSSLYHGQYISCHLHWITFHLLQPSDTQ